MSEALKTAGFAAAALGLALAAASITPERYTAAVLRDQGEPFYPAFTDPQAAKTVEVIDYDEATATARPLKVEFQKGRWVIASHHNYRIDVGDRLVKTSAALMDLRKDMVASDSPQDHAKFGVADPLDPKVTTLSGRGKRVTLRDAYGAVLADFVLGKPAGKPGQRYIRVPGQKRTYIVKTDADPSARFADWVNAGLLRIPAAAMRRITVNRYAIDEASGRLTNVQNTVLEPVNNQWQAQGNTAVTRAQILALVQTLDTLKISGVRPKPRTLAEDLRQGQLRMTLEAAMSLRQRGFFLAPSGRLFANEGEMSVETRDGVVYQLRFGEVATIEGESKGGSENRHVLITAVFDATRAQKYGGDAAAGERASRAASERFADWYYIIGTSDVQRLTLRQ